MSLLFRILYAAHANGSHHKLALDALGKLDIQDDERGRRLFLAHAKTYLEGSKAPDTTFKDFTNHVLHVRDGYWGGAATQCEVWYGRLVEALGEGRWPEAIYAAGVLSHYYTDPIHPFHTGQSKAENDLHRAVEWSISRSYDALARIGARDFAHVRPRPGQGPQWLREFVASGADTGNRYYESLLTHYDLDRGVTDPPEGLDTAGRQMVAELIAYATSGFARILERAFAESSASPPEVELTAQTVLAALQMPLKFYLNRIENAAEREAVRAMYHELKTTGRVESTLGEAERLVREAYSREVLPAQDALRKAARKTLITNGMEADALASLRARPIPDGEAKPILPALVELSDIKSIASDWTADAMSTPNASAKVSEGAGPSQDLPASFLDREDDIERAPSIGPKTAARLRAIGVRTVADLLDCDPVSVSAGLSYSLFTAATVSAWQSQARLVIDVPGLRGTHAQLLTGAGFANRDEIAATEPGVVCARILAFATTPEGQRVLRECNPPDLDRVASWVEAARAAAA